MKVYLIALSAGLLLSPPSLAQREVLDDSLSPQRLYSMEVAWEAQEILRTIQAMMSDQNAELPPLTGRLNGVEVRLDTRRYVGRRARIFLRLPTAMPGADGVGDLELRWRSNGRLLGGSVSPGQEALLFEGMIDDPVVSGVLNFQLTMGAGGTQGRFNLEPLYEIEIIS
jgi:hypothetical protein